MRLSAIPMKSNERLAGQRSLACPQSTGLTIPWAAFGVCCSTVQKGEGRGAWS